jgi:hypothetical protein
MTAQDYTIYTLDIDANYFPVPPGQQDSGHDFAAATIDRKFVIEGKAHSQDGADRDGYTLSAFALPIITEN